MIRPPPRSTRTDTLLPYTTLFRSHYEADAARSRPRGACETRGIADLTRPFDTNIGRELLHDLIAKAQPQLDVGQARTDPDLGNVLQREVDLRHRLEDQSLGEALIIIASEPGVQVPLVRQKDRAFDLEPIRSEERRVGKECVSTCRSRWSPYP